MVIFGGSYLIINCVGTEGTKEPLSESAAKSTNLEFGWIKLSVISLGIEIVFVLLACLPDC